MHNYSFTSYQVGASALIKRLCDEMDMARLIDASVRWDEQQWKLSPGTLIVGLIVNILTDRQPLYKVAEAFQKLDIPQLFGSGVRAEDFNDDALGRALSRLAETDQRRLYSTLALSALAHDQLEIRVLHGDTTSLSVYGAYDGAEEPLHITFSYSKQHRPDLKQFMYGLCVTQDNIPVWGETLDGNTSDTTWNQQVLSELDSYLDMPPDVLYVADSALVTTKSLQLLHDRHIRFISRLPNTFRESNLLREKALKDDRWAEQGVLAQFKRAGAARYWTTSYEQELGDIPYRFIVVRSSALGREKRKTLTRQLNKEEETLTKELDKLSRERFACEPDAQKALDAYRRKRAKAHHHLEFRIASEVVVKRPPGRPKKGETPPEVTLFRIEGSFHRPSEEEQERIAQQQGSFVLITNMLDATFSDREALQTYKTQGETVEHRFRFLKNPMYVDGLYVKSPERADALAYVFLMALLVAAYLERRIRAQLAATGEELELLGKRKTDRPTVVAILEIMQSMQVIFTRNDDGPIRIVPSNTDARILRVLALAGYDEGIYTM